MLREAVKELLYVLARFGARLEEVVHVLLLAKFDRLTRAHLAQALLLREVDAVARKVDHHVLLVSVLFNLLEPARHILKGVFLRHVIDDYRCLAVLVEVLRDAAELLLPSGVPNLELDGHSLVDAHHEGAELDADSYIMVAFEGSLGEPLHETALAYA